mmetsp:Transcript_26240/g.40672  ORF Transcript_26240/g.40672 Transcript_26240/m.40672 type:complete len:144 (+) Transcript_26240:69-500(+)
MKCITNHKQAIKQPINLASISNEWDAEPWQQSSSDAWAQQQQMLGEELHDNDDDARHEPLVVAVVAYDDVLQDDDQDDTTNDNILHTEDEHEQRLVESTPDHQWKKLDGEGHGQQQRYKLYDDDADAAESSLPWRKMIAACER